jgi:antitoxin (DNA-binding transcriptional repressor) of toxin-antitoxin stability system
MKIVAIHEAKTNLSRLIVARKSSSLAAAAVARLVPIAGKKIHRKLGILKGKLVVGQEFFDALPEEDLARWE